MLISCFQCRTQLEVPDDCAGKRVRCRSCQHVIVVPGSVRAAEPTDGSPATAMPSLDLDEGETGPSIPAPVPTVTSVPATSIPPFYPPPPDDVPRENRVPAPSEETDEPPPPRERGGKRRSPIPLTPKRTRWGRSVGIGLIVGVVACVVVAMLMSVNWGRRPAPPRPRRPAVVFHKPADRVEPVHPIEKPPVAVPAVFQWRMHQDQARRFQIEFPGPPDERVQAIDNDPMNVLEYRNGDWEFSVAHLAMTDRDFAATPLAQRFATLEQFMRNRVNGFRIHIEITHQGFGRAWVMSENNGRRFLVRSIYSREGDLWHHYVLSAKGPNFIDRHPDFDRFFNSFVIAPGQADRSIQFEEIDDLNLGARRDNEFTSFVRHPEKPIAAVGLATSQVRIHGVEKNNRPPIEFVPSPGKPVEQLALSRDGKWLAVAVAGEVQFWRDWDSAPNKVVAVPGVRCTFAKDDRVLILKEDCIKEFSVETREFTDTIEVPDLSLRGLALSADHRKLAAFGANDILLWDWPTRKLLGNIEAHAKAITTVAFSPDGASLASASVDRSIKLWDVKTLATSATLNEHAWTVASLAFQPDGRHLASAGLDGMLILWNLEPKEPTPVWAQSHRFPIRAIQWSDDGKNLYLTCKHLRMQRQPEGRQFARQFRKLAWLDIKQKRVDVPKLIAERAGLHIASSASAFHCAPDGETFVSAPTFLENTPGQRKVRIWNAADGSVTHEMPAMNGSTLSPDGKWILFSSLWPNAQLQLMEVATGRILPARAPVAGNFIPPTYFSHDSQSVWVQQKHELVRYEIPTLAAKQRLKLKEPKDPQFIAVWASLDHRSFLTSTTSASRIRQRTLYAAEDGHVLAFPQPAQGAPSGFLRIRKSGILIELEDLLYGTTRVIGQQRGTFGFWAIHPKSGLAATEDFSAGRNLRINLWDLGERKPILTIPTSATRSAGSIRFSADGRTLAYTMNGGWTRVLPTRWLLERKHLLPPNPGDVAAP